jgi:Zn-dependent protease
VKIDLSWIVIAVLVAWSLSTGLFPFRYKDLSTQAYWIMGILGALGLFLSIIVHEFSHSLVARRYNMHMKGITLFIFGGVAEMEDEPPAAKAEFFMALAGPVTSVAAGLFFYGLYTAGKRAGFSEPVNGVLGYLAFINWLLAAFNLIPAFPLDGGRILRAALWAYKKNLRWASRVSSAIGSGFGFLLIFIGILNVLTGNFVGGMWWFIIGIFLQGAAKMSYRRLLLKRTLEGETVRRFMKSDVITVRPETTIRELVEDYIYTHHYKMFPVVDDRNRIAGCITTREVKGVSRDEWPERRVMDLAGHCSPENTVGPDRDATEALSAASWWSRGTACSASSP